MAFEVVIVDDSADIRVLLQFALERSGRFEVVGEAENGARGIEVVALRTPDIVLLDVSMPVLDGLAALPEIKAVSPASCVVMLSGYADFAFTESAHKAGAFSFIEKTDMVSGLVPHLLDILAVFRGTAVAS